MSLYFQTYGPINKHTTMFKPYKKGHPDYVGGDDTPFAKSFVRYDVPHSMQYPGRFDDEKWYSVNRQHTAKEKKLRIGASMEKRRLCNIEKSVNRCGISRSLAIRYATPRWLTASQRIEINRLKNIVKKLNKRDGANSWSLDHIIPLRGELVSGLHIPSNLVVMDAKTNTAKGNYFKVD